MPITITITAANAHEAAQLVHDLADTISRMSPADIPEHTEVSTIDRPAETPAAPPKPSAAPPEPVALPQAPAAVPVAAPAGATPQPAGQAPAAASPAAPTAATVPTAAPPAPTVPTAVPASAPQPAVPTAVPAAPQPQTAAPAPAAVPTTAQSYTLDQLAVAATQLMDAGRRDEVVQLLHSFGVQALTALPKEQYGAFATALRQLGAKI